MSWKRRRRIPRAPLAEIDMIIEFKGEDRMYMDDLFRPLTLADAPMLHRGAHIWERTSSFVRNEAIDRFRYVVIDRVRHPETGAILLSLKNGTRWTEGPLARITQGENENHGLFVVRNAKKLQGFRLRHPKTVSWPAMALVD